MHVHTTASDGILAPSDAILWSKRLGLKGIAITDHDTVDGIPEGIAEASKHEGFILIPGIEFSALYENEEVHILGYFIDHTNKVLTELTREIKDARFNRGQKIIKQLQSLGYNLSLSDIPALSEDTAIGRPHIARLLVEKSYFSSIQEAFEVLLKKGKPAYVERFKLSVDDAIDAIISAEGLPVLAHPGLLSPNCDLNQIISKGIKGIEVFHTKHDKTQTKRFKRIAESKNLHITGGSDYHDNFNNGIPTIGSVTVPLNLVSILLKNHQQSFL